MPSSDKVYRFQVLSCTNKMTEAYQSVTKSKVRISCHACWAFSLFRRVNMCTHTPDPPSAIKDIHHHPPAVTLDVRHPLSSGVTWLRNKHKQWQMSSRNALTWKKHFFKAISWNYLSHICCWQPSIVFCQNVSKLQLFLESEQKKFYSPADFHARLLSSLIPLQNGIKSAPARKWSDVHL